MADRVLLATPTAKTVEEMLVAYNVPHMFVSAKLDGIRAHMSRGDKLTSRNGKYIPNRFVSSILEGIEELRCCDGELITFTNGKMDSFNTIQSKVMSVEGKPDFAWYLFDNYMHPEMPYEQRQKWLPQGKHERVKVIVQHQVHEQHMLDHLENHALSAGYEGLMARRPDGPYKLGRSTDREGILLKVIRKNRAEAVIVGGKERMHNGNELTVGPLGYAARTSHKDNKIGRDDLGAFELEWDGICDGAAMVEGPIYFSCGTGFDDAQRIDYWLTLDEMVSRRQKVVFEFRGVGTENRPRFPAFIGMYQD